MFAVVKQEWPYEFALLVTSPTAGNVNELAPGVNEFKEVTLSM